MSAYTKHYKLIKPSYDEDIDVQDINNNMDVLDNTINGLDVDVQNITSHIGVIDNTINGLDFVQDAYKDNNGLHLNKRSGSSIDVPLNYLKDVKKTDTGLTFTKNGENPVNVQLDYLPLTGGRIRGRTYIDSMLSVGQSNGIASNIRVDGAAGNAYMALLNYNNVGNLLIDGYFNNPETAKIDVTNRNAQGDVRYRSTLMDGRGDAKFANDVYANGKLLATKEYVDSKKWGSTSIADKAVTPTKLDRAYLPLTGGNVTDNITVQNNQVLYATNTITDTNGNYYTEYSDGSIVCGGIFTDLNQSGSESGSGHAIETYARRVTYLKPITKTMIGMNAMLVPDDGSHFWGNSSACAMLRKSDTTGFYVEIRSDYTSMLTNTSKCMWRAYFK